ncbi:MAG: hypothetical protein ACFFBD_00975 [Candidatus Hodarchaeota archaeon]
MVEYLILELELPQITLQHGCFHRYNGNKEDQLESGKGSKAVALLLEKKSSLSLGWLSRDQWDF